MTKKFVLVFLILVIINQRYSEMDYFNLEFIKFPKEITISKNIEMEELNVVIKCYYKYNGPTTVCKGNKGFFRYYISGDILYFDSKGDILECASKYIQRIKDNLKNEKINDIIELTYEGGPISSRRDVLFVPFAKDCIYSSYVSVINSLILKSSCIEKVIKEKRLSKIRVKIFKILIEWSSITNDSVIQGWQKKSFIIDVNQEIDIKVIYNGNCNLNMR